MCGCYDLRCLLRADKPVCCQVIYCPCCFCALHGNGARVASWHRHCCDDVSVQVLSGICVLVVGLNWVAHAVQSLRFVWVSS